MHGPLNVESSYDYKYWVRTPGCGNGYFEVTEGD